MKNEELKITAAKIGPYPRSMPEGMFDPKPKVTVTLEDGSEVELFSFYCEELRFHESEFIGLTVAEGKALHTKRDMKYLQS
jgi:hypothetical protein